jgi:predicted O-methyltransferase YrrM
MAMNWNLWNGEGADGHEYSQSIYELALKLQPKLGLEIGVRFGKSALPTLLASPDMTLIGVDPNPEFEIVEFMDKQGVGPRFHFVNEASPEALRQFDRESFDWIYIDGLHDYWGVWRDFVVAWHLLKPGGTMVMDDCDPTLGYGTGVLEMLQDWTEIITGQPFQHKTTEDLGLCPNPHKAAILTK